MSFAVPTGNFGNIYAAHLARAMGLPIERLVLATNANDILARYLASGDMSLAPVQPSLSPSMDIQVASNFERLLFELKGRSGAAVAQSIAAFRREGALPPDDQAWHAAAQFFAGHRVDDAGTLAEIGDTYRRTGILIDPHTAVAVAAALAAHRRRRQRHADGRSCDRAPRQIRRCCRACDGTTAGRAASPRRAHGETRAYDDFAKRYRRGCPLHPRARCASRARAA